MKYYRTNRLIIEYPTIFLGVPKERQITARVSWKVAWTELGAGQKIRFISKGDDLAGKRGARGQTSHQNIILVSLYCTKKEFIDAISKYFSEKFDVHPQKLKFRFKSYTPFGDLNEG